MQYPYYYKNKPGFKERRKSLRSWLTRAEYVLWQEIRKDKLGYKFRRQFSIGPFIVDFYCHELRLIVEVDGFVHDGQKMYDLQRDKWLRARGYYIVRFNNDNVLFYRERVLSELQIVCQRLAHANR